MIQWRRLFFSKCWWSSAYLTAMLRFIRPVPELTICSWIPSWIIGQQQGNMTGTNNFDIAEHPMPIYPGNQHNLGRSLRHDTLSPLPVSVPGPRKYASLSQTWDEAGHSRGLTPQITDGRYFTVRLKDTRLSYTDGTIYMGFNDVAAAKLVVWLS